MLLYGCPTHGRRECSSVRHERQKVALQRRRTYCMKMPRASACDRAPMSRQCRPAMSSAASPASAAVFNIYWYHPGIILVYGVVLILLALVWYSGMRKWYANQFDFLRPLAGSISMSTCVQTCPDMVGHGWTWLDTAGHGLFRARKWYGMWYGRPLLIVWV